MLVSAAAALAILLPTAGCGSSNAPPETETSSASPEQPAPSVSRQASPTDEDGSPDSIDGGMQLPDGEVPSGQDADSNGGRPAMPGEGGMEMPKIDATDSAAQISDPDAPQATSTAKLANWDEIQAIVKSTGKVTVVDLWSLACEPCLKEFPGLVKLDRELGSEVACIGVSTDFDGRKSKPAETYRPRVDAFLGSVGATFANFICETPNNDVYDELGLLSIPAVLVFDGSGKLVRQFVDGGETRGFGYEQDVIPFVESMVAQARD